MLSIEFPSNYLPSNRENRLSQRPLLHAFLQCVDEVISFPHDFVFDIEYTLPLSALLLLQVLDSFLERMLLIDGCRVSGLAVECLDLLLSIMKLLLSGQHHVLGPFIELLAGLVEIPAIPLKRLTDGRSGVAVCVCRRTLPFALGHIKRVQHLTVAVEESLASLLVERLAVIVEG
jgi:hypothetical protein